jgi:hypothetical protein
MTTNCEHKYYKELLINLVSHKTDKVKQLLDQYAFDCNYINYIALEVARIVENKKGASLINERINYICVTNELINSLSNY